MQSKTSFFNKKLFTKTVGRFWPIWATYAVLWLILPISIGNRIRSFLLYGGGSATEELLRSRYDILQTAQHAGVVITAIFAILAAMAVWSFMYSSRSAHGVACLPVKREGVFLSAFAAGTAPVIAVNALITVISGITMAVHDFRFFDAPALLQFFAMVSLEYIFFYGFASFCAQLTGNILVLPALYAVLNFTALVVENIVRWLLSLFVYGLSSWDLEVTFLSPAVYMVGNYIDRDYAFDASGIRSELISVEFSGWGVFTLYALVGIAFAAAALLLYRRRRMESAGDVVAIDVLKPIFSYCMAFGCALVLGAALYALVFEYNYHMYSQPILVCCLLAFMLLGAFVGWVASRMLIKKSFRVFRGGKWVGLGAVCLILAVLMLSCENDLFGYERRVPDADRLQDVSVSMGGEVSILESPENLSAVTELPRAIIDYKRINEDLALTARYPNYTGQAVTITYGFSNGRSMTRDYVLNLFPGLSESDALNSAANRVINCTEAISGRKKLYLQPSPENISYSNFYGYMYAADCAAAAGYDSVEDYILLELGDIPESELGNMSYEERRALLADLIAKNAMNSGDFVSDKSTEINGQYYDIDPDVIDLDKLIFSYRWSFTPKEICELYYDCLLPDIADGTLGRIWLLGSLDPDYLSRVYSFRISFELAERDAQGLKGDLQESFYTVPTVDSLRTVRWLSDHGVKLLTEGECMTEDFLNDVPMPEGVATQYYK